MLDEAGRVPGEQEGVMRVATDNPQEALDRVLRGITLVIRDAIQELVDMGHPRGHINITTGPEGEHMPTWVSLDGDRVFEVDFTVSGGPLAVCGRWLKKPRKRPWWRRLWAWLWGN